MRQGWGGEDGEHREVGFSGKVRMAFKQTRSWRGGEGPRDGAPRLGGFDGQIPAREWRLREGGLASEIYPFDRVP